MNALHTAKLTLAALVLYPFHFLRYILVTSYRRAAYKREARKMRSTFQRPLTWAEKKHLQMRHNFW